jgi:hypothetical protein
MIFRLLTRPGTQTQLSDPNMSDNSVTCVSCNEIVFTDSSRDDEVGFRCIQCDDFTLCKKCEHLASEYHPVMHSFIELRGYHFKNKITQFPNAKPGINNYYLFMIDESTNSTARIYYTNTSIYI